MSAISGNGPRIPMNGGQPCEYLVQEATMAILSQPKELPSYFHSHGGPDCCPSKG